MTWRLVLSLALPGGSSVRTDVGLMINRAACMFAGEAMAKSLLAQGLAAAVTVECTAQVQA